MFAFRMYNDPELRKIWFGYIEGPDWTLFIPSDGGKPSLFFN